MQDAKTIVAHLVSLMPQSIADARHPVYVALGAWFVDVVQTGKRYYAAVEDCGYDVSTFSRPLDVPFDLSQYQKMDEFLDLEIGPNTRATYTSGAGFLAETLDDVARDVCHEAFIAWTQGLYPGADFFGLWDELYDRDVVADEFHICFREWLVADVLTRYLSDGLALRARRQAEDDERERRFRASSAYGAQAHALMKQRLMPLGKFEQDRLDELKSLLERIESDLPDGRQRVAAALANSEWPFQVSLAVALAVRNWYGIQR